MPVDGGTRLLGVATETHGPGKHERTWLWRAPSGGEPTTEFEVVVRADREPGPWEVEAFAAPTDPRE